MIYEDSRYKEAILLSLIGLPQDLTDRIRRNVVLYPEVLTAEDFGQELSIHVVEPGETLDSIAFDVYGEGNERLWWVLGQINNVIDPFDLRVGMDIIIPPLTEIMSKGY